MTGPFDNTDRTWDKHVPLSSLTAKKTSVWSCMHVSLSVLGLSRRDITVASTKGSKVKCCIMGGLIHNFLPGTDAQWMVAKGWDIAFYAHSMQNKSSYSTLFAWIAWFACPIHVSHLEQHITRVCPISHVYYSHTLLPISIPTKYANRLIKLNSQIII